MIGADDLEVRMVASRLEASAIEVGLLNGDVARLLGRLDGAWPMPLLEQWSLIDGVQERRLRELGDVCRGLSRVLGDEAPQWLRRPDDVLCVSPLEFLLSDPEALGAMRRALMAAQVRASKPAGVAINPVGME